MLQAPRRLSGIRFETQPPAPAVVLPRMDVAGFVGYAASGPLDTPVAVEDPARFAEIFGADVELAWDAARGEPAFAALGPAVRGFFRNGGRRCHVVRVADEGARATAFQLPGLVALDVGPPEHALLRTRSVGTWADGLAVAVSVAATSLLVRSVALHAGTFELVPGAVLAPGDMVRLELAGWTLLAVVASVDGAEVTTGARLWTQPLSLPAGPLERAHWIGPSGAPRSTGAAVAADGRLSLRTTLERGPAEGSLLRLTGGPGEVWATTGARERGGDGVLAEFAALHLRRAAPPGLPRVRGAHTAERLEAELWVEGAGARHRLGGLGLAPAHPRYLGALPDDEALYTARDVPELWVAAREPRFPLAGRNDVAPATPVPSLAPGASSPRAAGSPPAPWAPAPAASSPASASSPAGPALPAYFPIAVSPLPEPKLPALPPAGSARRRDGLERFRASVFLDTRLETTGVLALPAQARDLQELAPLRGLHALLNIDEVTLVAVPDAAQAGWANETVKAPAPPTSPPPPDPAEPGAFEDCAAPSAAPDLRATGDSATGTLALSWSAPPRNALTVVEEAADAEFQTAAELYRGTRTELALGGRAGAHWFRARFLAGTEAGPYAVLGPVGAPARARALLRTPDRYAADTLITVQRALVRMCAARGDVLAMLALPEHYREDEAAAHPRALRSTPAAAPPLGEGEELALSYAALYHPWLVTASEERPGELRRVPPDGALAGVAARRAAERGAWVAPANVALPDVVALSPALDPSRRLDLLVAQVNVVEPTPRGFTALAADTLFSDIDLRPVNVRRLLQLLRRLALRDGAAYAFEPLGDPLVRAAQRGFETALGALFDLGAFSGTHPADGFRVVAYLNPDAAQLVVELRVAPSRPLAFITVRLVRGGDGRLLVELVG